MEDADGAPLVTDELSVGGSPLRLVRPASADALLEQAVAAGADEAPYWADLWPSARALADHVAALPLAGVSVLEVGCGLGLVSLAAARAGAHVRATDVDADALRIVARSARANGLALTLDVLDLADERAVAMIVPARLVLAADVLYDVRLARALGAALPRLVAPGGRALVTYPHPGQADALRAALDAAGLVSDERRISGQGRRGPTSVHLLEARAPG